MAAGQIAVILLVSKTAENAHCFLNVPLPGQCTHTLQQGKEKASCSAKLGVAQLLLIKQQLFLFVKQQILGRQSSL